jgi:hypothetical protein
MWEEVGGSDVRDQIVVNLGMRHTLEKERIKEALKKSGEEEPVATQYVFCELCRRVLWIGDWEVE